MRIALTGATGFVGRAFVPAALAAGHEVRALVRVGRVAPPGAAEVTGDLGEPAALDALVDGAEVVVHLGALGVQGRDRDPARMAAANVAGSLALAEAMGRARVRRLVAAGTVLELAPGDAYGASRAAAREALAGAAARLGLDGWWLRLASLYGPGDDSDKLLPAALAAARAGRPFEMTPGEQVREWLHVDDAVAAVLAAVARPSGAPLEVVEVGTGEGIALVELVRRLVALAGAGRDLVRAGARPYRPGEVMRLVMDPAPARARLGWAARIDLADGLTALAAAGRDGGGRG